MKRPRGDGYPHVAPGDADTVHAHSWLKYHELYQNVTTIYNVEFPFTLPKASTGSVILKALVVVL
jgi:hypothetical protein